MRNTGRPRLDPADQSVAYTFRLPARELDRLRREAARLRLTLAELLRQKSFRVQK